MSIRTKSYDAYLETYGHMYGDMSDPIKRAQTVASLRKRDARVLASAYREIRAKISKYSTKRLKKEHHKYVWLTTSEHCERFRYQGSSHMRNVDVHQLRMLSNECRRRGIAV